MYVYIHMLFYDLLWFVYHTWFVYVVRLSLCSYFVFWYSATCCALILCVLLCFDVLQLFRCLVFWLGT